MARSVISCVGSITVPVEEIGPASPQDGIRTFFSAFEKFFYLILTFYCPRNGRQHCCHCLLPSLAVLPMQFPVMSILDLAFVGPF